MRKPLSLIIICLLSMGLTPQQKVIILSSVPNWVPNRQNPPDIAINWQQNIAWKKNGGYVSISALGVTITRASAETNLLSTSPSGFAYTSVPSGVIASGPAFGGRQTWESRTNFLLNSTAPVTQTTGSLANGTYTLWVNGSGTATMSSGTATGCGTSAASQGTPISFTTSGTAGTCTVTVSGSLNFFQLELNQGSVGAPSPGIVTAGATVTRATDVIRLTATFGSAYTVFSSMIPQAPTGYTINQEVMTLGSILAERVELVRNSGNADAIGRIISTVSGNTTSTSTAMAQGSVALLGYALASGAQAFSFNGALLTSSGGLPTTPTTINFGSRTVNNDQLMNGLALIDAIWLTQAVPSAQLQSMN